MARLEQRTVLEIVRSLKVFFRLEARFTRADIEEPERELHRTRQQVEIQKRQLEQTQNRLREKEWALEEAHHRLASLEARPEELATESEIDPRNFVWIFGTGRGGSTWLRSMMCELCGFRVWEEPMVGLLFGQFYDRAQAGQLSSRSFVLGEPARAGWIRSIRKFVVDRAGHLYPSFAKDSYLVIKEPNGSIGAPLIMEALPESRMILLIRDPRDVIASVIDATKKGSWLYERKQNKSGWSTDPERMARERARRYLEQVGRAKEAYGHHEGPKALVRYEDLAADTLGTMKRLYTDLRIEVDWGELETAVEKHSWENIPEEEKGEGKFYRKGASGGWREDLTEKQIRIVEEIASSLLEEFYPGSQSNY